MDYEIGFKIVVAIILGWFTVDKKNTREDIKALERRVNSQGTSVAVLESKIIAIKEDTAFIRNKLGD